MLTIVMSTALAFCATDDTQKELAELAGKIGKAESYQFTSVSEAEGGGFGGGGAGRGGGGRGDAAGGRGGEGGAERERPAPPVLKGTYKKGQPLRLQQGEVVAYKDGDQVVHKNAEGEWQVFELPQSRGFGERGQGGGERGGERGGQGGGERGGERGGQGGGGDRPQRRGDNNMRGLFTLSRATAPHGMFADFAAKVEGAKKAEQKEGEVIIFTGKLTEAAAKGMGPMFGRGGRGGGGGGGPQIDTSGTFTIKVVKGSIAEAKFAITISGTFGERSFERTTIQTVTFDKVGEAKLEVPEEALALFEI